MMKKSDIIIKHSIPLYTVATEKWKNGAERELSDAIAMITEQLANLEYEAYDIINEIRNQSATVVSPLLMQKQIDVIQQQINVRKAELEDQQYSLLEQQSLIQEIELEDILEQGQLEGLCHLEVGDNLMEKLERSIVVRDGRIESIKNLE
ncbi:MAG TPA: YlqD family protein [Prochlorococcaceae cyanobacterium AMR_MDS_5431]|nr:YlqD family protein [Prochlorococcaceae cyanobacterium AMR_MDS_5431]